MDDKMQVERMKRRQQREEQARRIEDNVVGVTERGLPATAMGVDQGKVAGAKRLRLTHLHRQVRIEYVAKEKRLAPANQRQYEQQQENVSRHP